MNTISINPQVFINFAVAVSALLVSLAALLVQARRARIMTEQLLVQKRQIAELERTRSLQELRSVIKDLLDVRSAVENVLALEGKDLETWTEQDIEAAHIVCARFSLIGILILEKMVPEQLFAKAWYYSVPKCYAVLKPFLEKIRRERDYRYWSSMDVLVERIAQSTRDFRGFSSTRPPQTD